MHEILKGYVSVSVAAVLIRAVYAAEFQNIV